jgi:Zn-finger nucleic acid-binding protein
VAPAEKDRKISAKAFVDDFVRGASEGELCEKYACTRTNLTRMVEKLRGAGLLTQAELDRRRENLKIRFGSPQGPPKPHDERGLTVDPDTGLVLHCPSCGGPVTRGAAHCEYCRSPLDFDVKGKTIPCPHCFASNPADSSFCIRCARPLKGLIRDGEVLPDRLCPRCDLPMSGKRIGQFSVVACTDCSGLFIANDIFELMQENSARVPFPVQRVPRVQLTPEAAVRYIRCPVCRNIMNRTNFGRISGVIVDSCSAHGIWFDADELEKIMDFIARGGLQKSQLRELEELKAENERIKVRNMTTTTSQSEYGGRWGLYRDTMATVDVIDVLRDIFRLFKR